MQIKRLLILFIFFPLLLKCQFYNGAQLDFGKNRVQYKKQDWQFYRYDRFDVYFYSGGKELAPIVGKASQYYLQQLELFFDYTLENRPQLLIFDRLSDLKQSNVGIESPIWGNLGGVTKQVGNKILLYQENGHSSFLQQLKEGINEAFISEFIYGSNFRERARSAALLNIPDWYFKGLIQHLSSPWNSTIDNITKTGILEGTYLKFNKLEGQNAIYAGLSIWNYISETYGEKVIPNIVEMTRISRSVESGFEYVLGIGFKALIQEWINYYDKKYYYNDTLFKELKGKRINRKASKSIIYRQLKFNSDGSYVAYVKNDLGKNKLYIQKTNQLIKKKVARIGRKLPSINDLSFPQLAWHPNKELLVYTEEYKNKLYLNFYNIKTKAKEKKFINQVLKIVELDVSPNGQNIAITAIKDGKVDLYVFNNVSNTLTPITNDFYDEASPHWMPDGESIVFTSNRMNDTIANQSTFPLFPESTHDIFLYKPSESNKVFKRLTYSKNVNEQSILPLKNNTLLYLSNENGINNSYIARFDSAITTIDTITHYRYFIVPKALTYFKKSIIEHGIDSLGNLWQILINKGRFGIFQDSSIVNFVEGEKLPLTKYFAQQLTQLPTKKGNPPTNAVTDSPKVRKIVVFGEDKKQPTVSNEKTSKQSLMNEVKLPRQRVYETAYYSDYLVTQIDRGFLNQTYQPYSNSGFINPSINGLFRLGLTDLFEDYKIVAGIRLAGNLTGNEYLLAFQNLKKRLDKTVLFHRQGLQNIVLNGRRVTLQTITGKLNYPFSEVARINGSISYRNDRTVFVSNDLANLIEPNQYKHWAIAKAEYVYDNTFPLGLNMLTGTRFKTTIEHIQQLNIKKQSVTVIGFDYRYYHKFWKDFIFAIRAAGATSFGPGKLLFYLGGVDGWFAPKYDSSLPIDETKNYLFQTIATNMRGFFQNVRNGNSFAVTNTEFRWSIFRNLYKYPLKSDFLNALQFVGFTDIGTAFTGSSPWSESNTFNQKKIKSGPITVILKNLNEPIVVGYGLGLRSRLLGYFIRADYAWGIMDGIRLKPVFYLTLNTDF